MKKQRVVKTQSQFFSPMNYNCCLAQFTRLLADFPVSKNLGVVPYKIDFT